MEASIVAGQKTSDRGSVNMKWAVPWEGHEGATALGGALVLGCTWRRGMGAVQRGGKRISSRGSGLCEGCPRGTLPFKVQMEAGVGTRWGWGH